MLIDIQVYSNLKRVFHKQELLFEEVVPWMTEKMQKNKVITEINIEVYSTDLMPVGHIKLFTSSIRLKEIDAIYSFLEKIVDLARQGKLKRFKLN